MNVDNLPKQFGRLRRHYKLSQLAMGKHIGIGGRSWQDYENGVRTPGAAVLAALGKKGVNLHWLFTGEGEMFAAPPEVKKSRKPKASPATPAVPFYTLERGARENWYKLQEAGQRNGLPKLDKAMAIQARGMSLAPEGVKDGAVCYADTQKDPKLGDVVFVKGKGIAGLKVYGRQNERFVWFKAWHENPYKNGVQPPFYEQCVLTDVELMAPVVFIERS